MDPWLQTLISIVCALAASSGFWAYIQKKSDRKDAKSTLVMGIAHYKIVEMGTRYIDRGNITRDEYENLYTYLYEPYRAMGGNGTAEKIMREVDKLPMTSN